MGGEEMGGDGRRGKRGEADTINTSPQRKPSSQHKNLIS